MRPLRQHGTCLWPASAAEARRFTRACLPLWGMEALTEDAVAVVSELVANAVNATPPDNSGLGIIVALHAVPPGLRISVWDVGPGHPRPCGRRPQCRNRARPHHHRRTYAQQLGMVAHPAKRRESRPRNPNAPTS
jgi:anti-sigma regulatory factor (Ser/Thr protein kinase)